MQYLSKSYSILHLSHKKTVNRVELRIISVENMLNRLRLGSLALESLDFLRAVGDRNFLEFLAYFCF